MAVSKLGNKPALDRVDDLESQTHRNQELAQEFEQIILDMEDTAARSSKDLVAVVASFALVVIITSGLYFYKNYLERFSEELS